MGILLYWYVSNIVVFYWFDFEQFRSKIQTYYFLKKRHKLEKSLKTKIWKLKLCKDIESCWWVIQICASKYLIFLSGHLFLCAPQLGTTEWHTQKLLRVAWKNKHILDKFGFTIFSICNMYIVYVAHQSSDFFRLPYDTKINFV